MAFVDKEDVAQIIGLNSGTAFLRIRARLEQEHDFPLPLPTCQRPLRWRREEVAAWVTLQGRTASDQPDQKAPRTHIVLLREAMTA
ncbi:hypothetical protein KX928_23180 [Roseobacter sp. YSTF-M11]|uniref:Uncharacterized protein n=1 Tax=Roseobacter insulae TaxID=2859783 RepID=A0A9X1FZY8_9RHOB|nr:hypothetical protein [Roseobacter insulae]MBW4710703.1 hypothetical protein [Roseobacter insulae]